MNCHRCQRQQSGAAMLMAMMIVALVATLSAAIVWQQWRSVQVEAAERARLQSTWVLNGALDWARLILREDRTDVDGLDEPWAVPLAEARLSTFLAADKDHTADDDGPEAFLSGAIEDAQARYNLSNLIDVGTMKVLPNQLEAFARLCDFVGVSGDVAQRIANNLVSAQAAAMPNHPAGTSNNNALLLPQSVTQLKWFGLDDDTLRRLEPFVIILPSSNPTPVNVNTASREVIAAVMKIDLGSAERLVQRRQRGHFKSLQEVSTELGNITSLGLVNINTQYFIVRGRLRLGDKVLEESSIVWRRAPRNVVPINLRRESLRQLS